MSTLNSIPTEVSPAELHKGEVVYLLNWRCACYSIEIYCELPSIANIFVIIKDLTTANLIGTLNTNNLALFTEPYPKVEYLYNIDITSATKRASSVYAVFKVVNKDAIVVIGIHNQHSLRRLVPIKIEVPITI